MALRLCPVTLKEVLDTCQEIQPLLEGLQETVKAEIRKLEVDYHHWLCNAVCILIFATCQPALLTWLLNFIEDHGLHHVQSLLDGGFWGSHIVLHHGPLNLQKPVQF